MLPNYCYLQLTPLPKVSSLESPNERELRFSWLRREIGAFEGWAGIGFNEAIVRVIDGYDTKFLFLANYVPANCLSTWDRAFQYFIEDIHIICIYGGKNASLDGKRLDKRARWCRRLKDNWNWTSNLVLFPENVYKRANVETKKTEPMPLGAKLILLTAFLAPFLIVLLAMIAKS